jgi:outer membrane protein TolC
MIYKNWNTGRFLKIFCCLLTFAAFCANLQADEILRLTADEAVELAIRNNLSLESSRINLATRRRASELSWNQFIPNLTVSGTLNRDNEASTITGMAPVDLNLVNSMIPPNMIYGVVPFSVGLPQWRVIGNVQASLTISAAMFENMRRLRFDYESGLINFDKAKLQLERDVRKAYHNILLLQENIALMRGSYENVGRQVQMAQANFNAGLAPELVLLQARVALENMRPVIDQVENGLKLSMAQLAMFLGMNFDTVFELVPVAENTDFIPFDVLEMISRAAAGKPDIQELRHTILMLESARRMQTYSLYPSLTLSWNYNPIFTRDPWADSWFNNNYWMDRGSFSITLALRLHSLLPFSTDSQGIRNLEDQIRIANIGLAQMINGTEIEIYNIILALERTHTNAQALEQTVRLAEQSYRLTEQAYRAGLQDYFQVQNAEQSLRQARVQLLEQQFTYLNGLIDLEYSIGVPFGTLSKPAASVQSPDSN